MPSLFETQLVKRIAYILMTILVFVAGIACLSYPFVSNAIIHAAQDKVAKEHVDVVSSLGQEEHDRIVEEAIQYNRDLIAGKTSVINPFNVESPKLSGTEYWDKLNPQGNGVMATLYIPEIGVDLPIYHGVGDDVLAVGVGHIPTTSLPIGGESTYCVLAGHNGLPSVRIFDDLEKLEPGDMFAIRVMGEEHGYVMTGSEVILPNDSSSLIVTPGKDFLTLITCTPYGINTHRLLVNAERCELPPGWDDQYQSEKMLPATSKNGKYLVILGAALAVVALFFIVSLIRRRRRARWRGYVR